MPRGFDDNKEMLRLCINHFEFRSPISGNKPFIHYAKPSYRSSTAPGLGLGIALPGGFAKTFACALLHRVALINCILGYLHGLWPKHSFYPQSSSCLKNKPLTIQFGFSAVIGIGLKPALGRLAWAEVSKKAPWVMTRLQKQSPTIATPQRICRGIKSVGPPKANSIGISLDNNTLA